MGKKRRPQMQKRKSIKQRFKSKNPSAKISKSPAGESMSDMILEFIDPYLTPEEDLKSFKKLVTIALTAWNFSLIPEDERDPMLAKMRDDMTAAGQWIPEMDIIIAALVKRKQQHFAQYKRFIVDFEVRTERNGDFHLSVASTPPVQE